MNSKKVFFISFVIAFSAMLMGFMGLYWLVDITPQDAGVTKSGIPIQKVGTDDSKTLLLCTQQDNIRFFSLIKFNAIQNKVSIVQLPSSIYLSKAERTLDQSADYAGMLQCVYDLKQQYNIAIDYYLKADSETLGAICSSFTGFSVDDLQQSFGKTIQQLNTGEYMDTTTITGLITLYPQILCSAEGLEFLNCSTYILLKNNLGNLLNYGIKDIKKNFSYLDTSFNVEKLDKMSRILTFLTQGNAEFERMVLSENEADIEKLHSMLNE